MRRLCAAFRVSSILEILAREQIPSVGLTSAFPEAFGIISPYKGSRQMSQPDETQLQDKVNTLLSSGEETRKALARWRDLEDGWKNSPQDSAYWIEEASLTLRNMVLLEDYDPLSFFEEDEKSTSSVEESRGILDKIAQKVASRDQSQNLSTKEEALGGNGEKSNDKSYSRICSKDNLACLAKVIYGDLKYRQEPYEWVYEGLKPLLLDDVLQNQKGMCTSLAALYTSVGRRLGFQIIPECVPSTGTTDQQFGISLATAPTPDPWLLRGIESEKGSQPFWLDPTTGKLFDAVECKKAFPTLPQAPVSQSPVPFWKGLIQVAMTAHQRRGDGDAVAHCLYQLLSLDFSAPEWQDALKPSDIRRF